MSARYYIEVSPELLAGVTEGQWASAGLKLIERWGPRRKNVETWLVEDVFARPEFEGCLVNLTISRNTDGTGAECYEVTCRGLL